MQTVKKLVLQNREIILLGTAHISKESMDEADRSIREMKPDCVAVELDEQRYKRKTRLYNAGKSCARFFSAQNGFGCGSKTR